MSSIYENKEIRKVFGGFLAEQMRKDPRIVVVDADLAKANGTFDLRKEFPDRAIDVGVAEADMVGVAAGLSSYGFIPFVTSFSPFATRRACDQITISVCYAKQNVKIVGSDPGITAEYNGGTHMGLEDVGVLRSLPDMVIFEPCDAVEMAKALPQIVEHYGPVYIRMRRKVAPVLHEDDYKFDLFKADKLADGKDISIFAAGIMVEEAVSAVATLKEQGISAELLNIHTIKPIDEDAIEMSAKKTGRVLVLENHNRIGGLYSAVSETLAKKCPTKCDYIAMEDQFGIVGKLGELKDFYGFTAENIVKKVKEMVK